MIAAKKDSIQESELVWGPEVITGPKFTKKLRVDEGTNAVIMLDGAYQETLPPGGHMLARFSLFRQCKIYHVDMKDRQLMVESQGELIIQEPAPLPVDISVVIAYRVVEPRIVALEVSRPLATLFDYTVEAMRDAVKHSKFEDFLTGGNASSLIYHHLLGRELDRYLGIQVLNVQIASLRGDERVRGLIVEEGINLREEQAISDRQYHVARREMQIQMEQALNQGRIAEAMRLTPEYVYLTNPQMFEMLYGNRRVTDELRLQGLIELARAGMIDVSAITGSSQDYAQALGQMLTGRHIAGQIAPGLPGMIPPGELRRKLEAATEVDSALYAVARIRDHQTSAQLGMNRTYVLQAGIRKSIPVGFQGQILPSLFGKEAIEFEIAVHAAGIDIKPDWTQKYSFRQDTVSSFVEFYLTPRESGFKEVRIEFYYERHWLAQIKIEVKVADVELASLP